jgi:hypothetical protein
MRNRVRPALSPFGPHPRRASRPAPPSRPPTPAARRPPSRPRAPSPRNPLGPGRPGGGPLCRPRRAPPRPHLHHRGKFACWAGGIDDCRGTAGRGRGPAGSAVPGPPCSLNLSGLITAPEQPVCRAGGSPVWRRLSCPGPVARRAGAVRGRRDRRTPAAPRGGPVRRPPGPAPGREPPPRPGPARAPGRIPAAGRRSRPRR